jgi:ABC-type iron transport system FetAB permease component
MKMTILLCVVEMILTGEKYGFKNEVYLNSIRAILSLEAPNYCLQNIM